MCTDEVTAQTWLGQDVDRTHSKVTYCLVYQKVKVIKKEEERCRQSVEYVDVVVVVVVRSESGGRLLMLMMQEGRGNLKEEVLLYE